MRLDRIQRLMLYNQYKIMEKLYPEEANYYKRAAQAVGDGYEHEYSYLAQNIYERGLSEDQCKFVYNVMGMHMRLKWAYDDLSNADKAEIPAHQIEFHGFDGNNETNYLGYARWIVGDGHSFQNIRDGGDGLNSHMPTLSRYQNMLNEWQARGLEQKQEITKEDILAVVSVGY